MEVHQTQFAGVGTLQAIGVDALLQDRPACLSSNQRIGARADDSDDFAIRALTPTKIVKIVGPGTQTDLGPSS